MSVCLPIFAVAVLSAVVPVAARYFIKDKILNFICVVFLSVAFTSVSVLFVGMNKSERVSVLNMMRRRIFNA